MFSSNKPALGSFFGSWFLFPIISYLSIIPESHRQFEIAGKSVIHITDEFLYAASAILSEQFPGLVTGGVGKLFDPWNKFSDFVQIIDRLKLPSAITS